MAVCTRLVIVTRSAFWTSLRTDPLKHSLNRWFVIGTAGLYLFILVAGTFAILVDCLSQEPEPHKESVRFAAEQYRTYYGADALSVIGEHTMAASFAPDGKHKRFLRRVTTELMREEGIIDGVAQPPSAVANLGGVDTK